MAKYSTLAELTASDVVKKRLTDNDPLNDIDNTPPADVAAKLTVLMDKCLDPIRTMWGNPITVNSGYRCPELNKVVGGVASSQHAKGEAADITTGSVANNKKLFDMTVAAQRQGEIEFDQLIDESGYKWLHVSYRATGNRNQILHIK